MAREVPVHVTEYRVRETSVVTDESLSRIINEEVRAGWVYDGMSFVPNEASKRPRMAFLIFTREVEHEDAPVEPRPERPRPKSGES